jgi:hypothetical protein
MLSRNARSISAKVSPAKVMTSHSPLPRHIPDLNAPVSHGTPSLRPRCYCAWGETFRPSTAERTVNESELHGASLRENPPARI